MNEDRRLERRAAGGDPEAQRKLAERAAAALEADRESVRRREKSLGIGPSKSLEVHVKQFVDEWEKDEKSPAAELRSALVEALKAQDVTTRTAVGCGLLEDLSAEDQALALTHMLGVAMSSGREEVARRVLEFFAQRVLSTAGGGQAVAGPPGPLPAPA